MKSVTEPSLSAYSTNPLETFARQLSPSFRPSPTRFAQNERQRSPNERFSDYHRPLACQTSRKELQTQRNQLQQRYESIERILVSENDNLKKQNSYLAGEVRRLLKRERHLRREMQEQGERQKQRQNELLGAVTRLGREAEVIKEYFQRQIGKVVVALQSDSLVQLKGVLSQFVGEVTAFLGMANEVGETQGQNMQREARGQLVSPGKKMSAQQEVAELTEKLQAIIAENGNSCKQPGVRRECIQIARQIKQIQLGGRASHKYTSSNCQQEVLSNYLPEEVRKTEKSTGKRSHGRIKRKRSEESEDKYKYPKQIYTKVTFRRNASKDNKTVRVDCTAPTGGVQRRF